VLSAYMGSRPPEYALSRLLHVDFFSCCGHSERPAEFHLVHVYYASLLPDPLCAVKLVRDIIQPLLDYGHMTIPSHPLRRPSLVETQVQYVYLVPYLKGLREPFDNTNLSSFLFDDTLRCMRTNSCAFSNLVTKRSA